ncbi:PREDICTED: UNC119-binding protein C5orf30 homolog isoform X2 [Myotis brandtii]|uniref:UNC119-binding protein C5orf30 homolog isoform X2 n=1 Tax=Myotis brandtii TaxID=109478 RepID=UPI000703D0A0|nr:PREDICTED: UNC119-binding protein C5orf30 homolog isoform X2 [Myotis brandtii]XP_014395360.1 PREDICTED: UNC119-binding protein C5orf30 homolog isoform X2 [Myotis brandtii]
MEVDVNGEARSTLSTLPLPVAEVSSPGKAEAEKPRCSSTPCSPMRRTVSGYQILHMDSNYLVGFTTGEELLKLAQKCTGGEESKGEAVPSLRSKQLDAGLARSSRLYKTRSRYYQPYEIPAVNGRRRRRMPSSGDKCTKSLPYEPYKALHGPLPLCLLKAGSPAEEEWFQDIIFHLENLGRSSCGSILIALAAFMTSSPREDS